MSAGQSTCARVKIQIEQELTLERQAFDAHMRITNGLTLAALEDINVEVWFTDEDGNAVTASSDSSDSDALFYIRVDEMSNIEDVSGSGQVAADTTADIHWLIIPAPGAANGLSSGKLYNVGATLTYFVGGEENTVSVSPDYIYVKPMPELVLDYFLPYQVLGDDPFTDEVESSTPFTLGVRVKNQGSGSAKSLKIESAQPKIVDNDQGLLINFTIQGSEVNGEAMSESLLVDFGTLAPDTTAHARWTMTCSLSGRFVDFDASFTHSDELGGELTSLIDSVNTHTLVRDVLVNLSGRDDIKDFLSVSDSIYTVYESDNLETLVTDLSPSTTVSSGNILTLPMTTGFVYTKITDPYSGNKILSSVTRSDGKKIKTANAWLSRVQDQETHEWDYYLNLFDVDTTGTYTLVFKDQSESPAAPVLQAIADKSCLETHQVSFLVEASDPNGTIPTLTASSLPAGAGFDDNKDGTAIFDWTPAVGQKGTYTLTFAASDTTYSTEQQVVITVYDADDSDMDGMTDTWEMTHFGTLDRDGTGDLDQDGVSDLDEFLAQTDPALDESAPTTPDPLYPHPNVDVEESTPELVIENSSDAEDDAIDYDFEIYADQEMTELVADQDQVAQVHDIKSGFIYSWVADNGATAVSASGTTTSWQVPVELPDNTRYYWRVRSCDQEGSSLWAYYNFFVNQANDPPSEFAPRAPGGNGGVDTLTPTLSVMNSQDPDLDTLTYTFEVFSDAGLESLVATSGPVNEAATTFTAWSLPDALDDQTLYFWRVTAADPYGATAVTPVYSFYVDTENKAPFAPELVSPANGEEVETLAVDLVVANAEDNELDPLVYTFELDTSSSFDSTGKQRAAQVEEGYETTSFQVTNLAENTRYYWRAKAGDGSAQSSWVCGEFFVNQINDAPSTPGIKNPGNNAWTDTQTPVLSLNKAKDADKDALEYEFEIYANASMTRFVYQAECETTDWTVPVVLDNNTRYYWHARAVDEHGVSSGWTDPVSFFIKTDYVDTAPVIEITAPFEDLVTNQESVAIQWADEDPDSSATIDLYWDTDGSGENGTLIVQGLLEDDEADTYTWDVSDLEDGVYYLYAVIQDEAASAAVYAPVTVTIDRTAPVLEISPQGGEYDEPVSVEIGADETAQIYYTLDGTTPGTGSTLYTGSVEISETATLKCMAVDGAGNACEVVSQTYHIAPDQVTLSLFTDSGNPISGIKVYAYTAAGGYTGLSAKTDDLGTASFDPGDFDAGAYLFKLKYLGTWFWSNTLDIPDAMAVRVTIPVQTLSLDISTPNISLEGYKVYLYSASGTYLGQYQETDENGRVSFELAVGETYKFKAVILGNTYWIESAAIQGDAENFISYDAGGGTLGIILEKDDQTPICDIKLYLFSPAGTYLGQYQKTGENGLAEFEVPGGSYKVRADYMGYRFWTDETQVDEDIAVDLTLPHKDVTITVSGSFQDTLPPFSQIKTYLFSPEDQYLNVNQTTDDNGQVLYSLPDRAYKIRADAVGQKFWTQEFTSQDTDLIIPMAQAAVTVSGSGLPQSDLKVYLFSEAGTYLNQYQKTDTQGNVSFTIPEGSYLFRADYEGSKFWSAATSFAADLSTPVEICVGGGSFEFIAQTDTGQAICGIKTYAFTANQSYIGLYGTTDDNGSALFDLADGSYMFRFDYIGQKYWTDAVTVPDLLSFSLVIPHETVQVSLATKNETLGSAKLYLYSKEKAYLGQYQVTNDTGAAEFFLPVGLEFYLRTTVFGQKFWSDAFAVEDSGTHTLAFDTGGGELAVTLQKDDLSAISGIKTYLYTQDSAYAGTWQASGENGGLSFQVPQGTYKLKACYLGYNFWSDPISVADDTLFEFTLDHYDTTILVQGCYLGTCTPVSGIKTVVYTEAGVYAGLYQTTDTEGQATYSLPDQSYKIRADYMGGKFWSDPFQATDTTLLIAQGTVAAKITADGIALEGAIVYLYNDTGQYLNTHAKTDADGRVEFIVPADASYKFRTLDLENGLFYFHC